MPTEHWRLRIIEAAVRFRKILVIAIQLASVVMANELAFLLRFDGHVPNWAIQAHLSMLPWLVAVRAFVFVPFRLYEGLWRYASFYDLRSIVLGVATSSAAFWALTISPIGVRGYPRSVLFIDALLLVCFLAGLRLARRLHREVFGDRPTRRVLIYGAGDAGERIVHDMKLNPQYGYEPIGFIDDDVNKTGLRIHGVQVLGTREELLLIVQRLQPHELLLAIPRADADALRGLLRTLEHSKIKISTLPRLDQIIDGHVAVDDIRELRVEDLLNRAPIGLDTSAVRRLIHNRRVMVTGAGGSIGSELCRQIASYRPERLVLFERYENSLFAIENDLRDHGVGGPAVAEIGDVTDSTRLEHILAQYKPEIVFHAAAHKHVPLMEQSPCEAVKNNVRGTRILAELAEKHGVDRFVFISTDKAVNPTSVMGATKRVAELVVQAQADGSCTSFFTVRFGNVLGSNGSVVPRFLDQIKAGGPVTVTHPEMRRFFMLIPEAVQLVLHAAAHGQPGATYVLEMGEQVRVLDMARNLIRLAGHVPESEIPIEFIGLRPGEKLYEELIGEEELVVSSEIEKVIRVRSRRTPTPDSVREAVAHLESLALHGERRNVYQQLADIVPEYGPNLAIEKAEARLRYAEPEPEPEREQDVLTTESSETCPACRGQRVHRSRTRSIAERVKKSLTSDRPFRCHDCGWRGWLPVLTDVETIRSTVRTPNLDVLDSELERAGESRPAAPAFVPRNLR